MYEYGCTVRTEYTATVHVLEELQAHACDLLVVDVIERVQEWQEELDCGCTTARASMPITWTRILERSTRDPTKKPPQNYSKIVIGVSQILERTRA